MSYQHILYHCEVHIAQITLNRPDKLNSFNVDMHAEVRSALAQVVADQARVLILTGAGRGFCAGQDLSDRAVAVGSTPRDLSQTIEANYKPLIFGLRNLSIPVIAAVNGVAAGAGASVALACDLVIAAESASFVQAFVKIGLMPDSGSSYFLPRSIGTARAMGLALLGDKCSAKQAADWGLIWQCVPDAELHSSVQKIAQQLAGSAPLATAAIKKAIYAADQNDLLGQFDHERNEQKHLGFSQDYQEGVTAFMNKRAPVYQGQ
jgi:2-(1,2-epoxy-1,2-dihydrophenyl)acetyl-CoA isomerase